MKLIKGAGLPLIIFLNICMFFAFLETEDASFLWVILINVVIVVVQLIVKSESFDTDDILEKARREVELRDNDPEMYMMLCSPDELRRMYITFLVYKRLSKLLESGRSDLDELRKEKYKQCDGLMEYFGWEDFELLRKWEKENNAVDFDGKRISYYYVEISKLAFLFTNSKIFNMNSEFLFDFSDGNELVKYLEKGKCDGFSETFLKKLNDVFGIIDYDSENLHDEIISTVDTICFNVCDLIDK